MIPPLNLILALISVESGGNDNALGDGNRAVGCMQIKIEVIEDVNRMVRRPNFYKPHDRFNRAVSMQIFRRYMHRYATEDWLGHKPTLKDMALIWRYGPTGMRDGDPDHYWRKVQKAMRALPPATEPHSKGPRT